MKLNDVKKRYMNVKVSLKKMDEHSKMDRVLKLSLKNSFELDDLDIKTEIELSDYVEIVDLLVKENLLCSIDDGSYRLHSTLVKSFLQENLIMK